MGSIQVNMSSYTTRQIRLVSIKEVGIILNLLKKAAAIVRIKKTKIYKENASTERTSGRLLFYQRYFGNHGKIILK